MAIQKSHLVGGWYIIIVVIIPIIVVIYGYMMGYIYMVLYPLLWQMMEWKSVGMMKFPIYGKIKIVPNHQPDIYISLSRWINYSHPIKIWLDPMQLTWPCHFTCVALYRWCIRRGLRNRPLRGCIQNPNETCEKNVSLSLSPWDL